MSSDGALRCSIRYCFLFAVPLLSSLCARFLRRRAVVLVAAGSDPFFASFCTRVPESALFGCHCYRLLAWVGVTLLLSCLGLRCTVAAVTVRSVFMGVTQSISPLRAQRAVTFEIAPRASGRELLDVSKP